MLTYKQYKLLKESLTGHTLGLKTLSSLGIVGHPGLGEGSCGGCNSMMKKGMSPDLGDEEEDIEADEDDMGDDTIDDEELGDEEDMGDEKAGPFGGKPSFGSKKPMFGKGDNPFEKKGNPFDKAGSGGPFGDMGDDGEEMDLSGGEFGDDEMTGDDEMLDDEELGDEDLGDEEMDEPEGMEDEGEMEDMPMPPPKKKSFMSFMRRESKKKKPAVTEAKKCCAKCGKKKCACTMTESEKLWWNSVNSMLSDDPNKKHWDGISVREDMLVPDQSAPKPGEVGFSPEQGFGGNWMPADKGWKYNPDE